MVEECTALPRVSISWFVTTFRPLYVPLQGHAEHFNTYQTPLFKLELCDGGLGSALAG